MFSMTTSLEQVVTVETVSDTISEGDETFLLLINDVTGPASIGNAVTVISITNDDSKFKAVLLCHPLTT